MSNVIVKENETLGQRFTQIQEKLCEGWHPAGDS